MVLFYLISVFLLLGGLFFGIRSQYRIHNIELRVFLKGLLFAALIITVMMILWSLGFLPDLLSTPIVMGAYSLVGGYLIGYSFNILKIRKSMGKLIFVSRSLLSDHVPAFAALVLILFGIYRAGFLSDFSITGIRLTSGLSLVGVGLLGMVLRIVPEFRDEGILFLDMEIPWDRVISWKWYNEEIVVLECIISRKQEQGAKKNRIKNLSTTIQRDQSDKFEKLLTRKIEEFEDERKKRLNELL